MEIYITDQSAFSTHLIGEWVSLPMEENNLKAKIEEILTIGAKACGDFKHEEIFITDYECSFMEIGEYDNIFKLNEIAKQADGLNDHELKMVGFLLRNGLAKDYFEAVEHIEDIIIHENCTFQDIAYDFVNECYNLNDLPSIISNNIDYESIGRQMEMEGTYFEEDGDIYEYLG